MKKNENKSVSKKKNTSDKTQEQARPSLKKEPLNTTDLEEVTGGLAHPAADVGPWVEC